MLAPLRRIVVHDFSDGCHWEVLECGHRQLARQDIAGPTNAYRRRCKKCKQEVEHVQEKGEEDGL